MDLKDKEYIIRVTEFDGLDYDSIEFTQNDTNTCVLKIEMFEAVDQLVLTIDKNDNTQVVDIVPLVEGTTYKYEMPISTINVVGTHKGYLAGYGHDNDRRTYGMFKYKIKDDVEVENIATDTEYPILNQLISSTSALNEEITIKEIERNDYYSEVVEAENTRISNEETRVTEFDGIKTEFDILKGDFNKEVVEDLQNQINATNTSLDTITSETERVVNVSYYGNDLVAINKAISEAIKVEFSTIIFDIPTTVNDTINIPCKINVNVKYPITYIGTHDRPCIKIGSDSLHNYDCNFIISLKSNSTALVTETNYIGLELVNAYNCEIKIVRIEGFYEGLRSVAKNSLGVHLCRFYLGLFLSNHKHIRLTNSSQGWHNGNDFFSGTLGGGHSNPIEGVVIDSLDSSYQGNNNNIFYGLRIEMGVNGKPIRFNGANNNKFINTRFENNGIEYLAKAENINDSKNYINTDYVLLGTTKIINSTPNQNAIETDLKEFLLFNKNTKDGIFSTNKFSIKGLTYSDYYSANVTELFNSTKILPTTQGVTLSQTYYAISFLLDTSIVKKFRVSATSDIAFNIICACYKTDGTQVINNDLVDWGSPTYVKTINANKPTVLSGAFGGTYKLVNEKINNEVTFDVHQDISKVRIIIMKASSNAEIRNIKAYSIGGNSNIINEFNNDYLSDGTDLFKMSVSSGSLVLTKS